MILSHTHAVVGHNEDGAKSDFEHMILVTAAFPGYPMWTAYTYVGDLSTGGWGYNEWGLAFTINQLSPLQTRLGGYGHLFITRRLLEAFDWAEVYHIIGASGQAVGANYQIMDVHARGIASVEIAGHSDKHFTHKMRIGEKPLFHANTYIHLKEDEAVSESSKRRMARVNQLPFPITNDDIRNILGDQSDAQYPIYHDDSSERDGDLTNCRTMSTVIFDLTWKTATVYYGNPRQGHVAVVLHLLANTTTIFS